MGEFLEFEVSLVHGMSSRTARDTKLCVEKIKKQKGKEEEGGREEKRKSK